MGTLKTIYSVLLLLISTNSVVIAQNKYQITPGPDLWYNSVDGLRIGVKIRGQMAGSMGDGPHRLDVGFWLGSKWPSSPFSYYASLTELVPGWSSFGSEASFEIISSIREGFYSHGLTFRKRWQNGFNENEYVQLYVLADVNKRFDLDYVALPVLWDSKTLYMFEPNLEVNGNYGAIGPISQSLLFRIAGQGAFNQDFFTQLEFEQEGKIELYDDFKLGHRIFFSTSSSNVPTQYQYRLSTGKAVEDLNNGFGRSKGTLPISGFEQGWLHLPDGPNLRAYGLYEMKQIFTDKPNIYRSSAAINLELDVPNPISWIVDQTPILGGILNNRMYFFNDTGQGWGSEKSKIQSNFGLGLSVGLNLPESLGKNKILTVRYDVPFWLSHPVATEPNFKYRSVLGFSNIIRW